MIKKKVLHLRGLNGIRAIAAVAVLISHISLALPLFGLDPLFTDKKGEPAGVLMASYGVTMFFVLSGFLITYLLLQEKEIQQIHIRHFYFRRILRIWPLYYLFLVSCIFFYFVFNLDANYNSLPLYIFFAANIALIINSMLPFAGHLWSIGVEEQFYIFWPWAAKMQNKLLLKFSILFVIVFYVIKLLVYIFKDNNPIFNFALITMGVIQFHVMILGSIGAILYYNNSKLIRYFIDVKTQIIVWLILLLAVFNLFHISSALIDHEVMAIVTMMIIFSQILRKNMIIDLDKKIFNFIGKISYGIYVIHPLLIFLLSKIIGEFQKSSFVNYLIVYFIVISITILLSYLSYNLYEKRFIKFKDKFAKIRSRA
jgi:peptidoglycan/LPS O-acetylase OafA/YrhL